MNKTKIKVLSCKDNVACLGLITQLIKLFSVSLNSFLR